MAVLDDFVWIGPVRSDAAVLSSSRAQAVFDERFVSSDVLHLQYHGDSRWVDLFSTDQDVDAGSCCTGMFPHPGQCSS